VGQLPDDVENAFSAGIWPVAGIASFPGTWCSGLGFFCCWTEWWARKKESKHVVYQQQRQIL